MNDRKQLAAAEFVELKTSAHTMNRYQQRSFDSFKSLNWWCQSFLVGIRTIFVGLRDKEGLAHRIEECAVGELHRNKPWSPAAVTIFLSNFLHELKLLMEHIDNSDAIVMLDFKATQDQVFYSVIRDDIAAQPEEQLLPTWYR
ncbi:decapping nuclease DXO homolog [Drosophila nasuta]|uniref:decapping nuclease DXO homolog n=1 Tax=Drosophila nasuta TaxID=42062 RepID=UPI00295E2D86|nr:decapping nuclease DXO homolog [Drosophila nasuta]